MSLVYLVAGEASGDVLGARLMRALRALRPEFRFAGVGGPRMQAEGLSSLFPMQDLAVMGLLEVLPRVLSLKRRIAQTAADIAQRRPAVVVTIDSPGFTLRLLRQIRPLGLKRVHYVAPQVWAWREGRVRHFPGLWDRLLCLLPFEPAFFARHGLAAEFVGHPVLESGADRGDGAQFRAAHGLSADARLLTMMPGSRGGEVRRLLPVYQATLQMLTPRIPGLLAVMPVAPGVATSVELAASGWTPRPLIVSGDKYDAFAASAAALTKSGTSTLELALAGVPMAVAYRVNPITAAIARRLIRVRYAALVNLLAEREVVPELIQDACTPARLADTLHALLDDPAQAGAQRAAFASILAGLAPPCGSPSDSAARAVLALLDQA